MNLDIDSLKVTLVLAPHDMRCGYRRLAMVAQDWLGIDVSQGRDLVVFASRSGGVAKMAWADGKGFNLVTRHLKAGCFQRLAALADAGAGQELSKAELMSWLDGGKIQRRRTNPFKG